MACIALSMHVPRPYLYMHIKWMHEWQNQRFREFDVGGHEEMANACEVRAQTPIKIGGGLKVEGQQKTCFKFC